MQLSIPDEIILNSSVKGDRGLTGTTTRDAEVGPPARMNEAVGQPDAAAEGHDDLHDAQDDRQSLDLSCLLEQCTARITDGNVQHDDELSNGSVYEVET